MLGRPRAAALRSNYKHVRNAEQRATTCGRPYPHHGGGKQRSANPLFFNVMSDQIFELLEITDEDVLSMGNM